MTANVGRFPLALFPPGEHQPWLDGTSLSGGQPINGAPQTADMSTGGWWRYDLDIGLLRTHAQHGAWRAMVGLLNSGVRLIEVPVLDALKPYPPGFPRSPIEAALAVDVTMPGWPAPPFPPTQGQIRIAVGAALQGGEYFTVIGPSGDSRMHMVVQITDVTDGVSTVTVVPPFREDMAAGTDVDFNDPRFLAKIDLPSRKDAWPRMTVPFLAKPKISFIESGFVVPDD